MRKAVVLLSGGMDSTVCLHWAVREYGAVDVRALFVRYSQPHQEAEEYAAVRAAKAAGVPFHFVLAPQAFGRGGLLAGGFDDARASVVPVRNGVFAAIAASHALGWWPGAASLRVVIGSCLDDAGAYPDCRPRFIATTAEWLTLGAGVPVLVDAPLLGLDKAAALDLARELGCLDAALASWSCYRGLPSGPCGACSACVARARGMAAAGLIDRSAPPPRATGGDSARDAALRGHRAGLLRRR